MGYCIAQTSLAHTYGNVTCYIADYVKNLFPKNYFKTIHISSMIAYKEFNIFQNTNKEFIRKSKPMLIIRPRVELNDQDVFLYNTFLTTRMTDNYMETSFTNLQPFIFDKERGNEMRFLLNRLKILFDVTIVNETQMAQLNQANFLRNVVRQDAPFNLSTTLESFVPRELLELMSEDIGIPMYDETGSVKPFIDYLNGVSKYPISYKIKNSSGNDEFFRCYPVNIDTSIIGLSIDDGSKRGMVSDAFTTSFTVSTEFYAAGLYYYFSSKPNFINKFVGEMITKNDEKIIPLFSIDNLDAYRIDDGWNVYAAPIFMVEPKVKEDVTDLSPLLNNSINNCIEYHKKHGIPYDLFIRFTVLKDNKLLRPGIDYVMNPETMKLTMKNCNDSSTYRAIIHVNTLYINQLLTRVYDLDTEK